MNIRIATLNDAADIQRIYAPYVEKTCITFEYDIPSVEEMKKRIENTLKTYPYLVAIEDNQIIGYAYASPYKGRKAYDWSCELSVYIDENYQHLGIGQQLYQKLITLLKKMNMQTVYACITHPHEQSENFHQKQGFHKNATFHKSGYKFHKWLDVIWMEKSIGDYGTPEPLILFPCLSNEIIDDCLKK
jgi:phosphinothricin acetyltransferase